MNTETFQILKEHKSYLIEKIEKINKKAIKFGCTPLKLTIDDTEIIEKIKDEITGMVIRVNVWVEATLEYEIPVIDGWELICTFDILHIPSIKKDEKGNEITVYSPEDNEIVTSKVPDKEIPIEYLNKKEIHCDHCGWNRNRHHSMLMKNTETNEYKEVGSTCIKDFFGHDPKNFIWMAQRPWEPVINEFAGLGGASSRLDTDFALEYFLSVTSACIKEWGWISGAVAYEYGKTSTKQYVFSQLERPKPKDIPHYYGYNKDWYELEITKDDEDLAKKVIEWAKNLEPEDNDYLANLNKIAKAGYVPYKLSGYAASMIIAYQKAMDLLKAKENVKKKESNWVGEIKERLEMVVECVYKANIDSDFGWSTLYIMIDENGNKFKTFYNGTKWEMEIGDTVKLVGTVKKHETYKDEKSTMLTRCNVVELIETAEEKKESKEND